MSTPSPHTTAELESGLKPTELMIMDHLILAWQHFAALPATHPDHAADFQRAIHAAQRILAARAMARHFPDYWGIGGTP